MRVRAPMPDGNPMLKDKPRFCVVVPVYTHWNLVPDLLSCLARQTLPARRYEVVLVNNGLDDSVLPQSVPTNVRIVPCGTPGSYAARNAGAEAAGGEWLVFTDADCRPSANWLAALDAAADTHGASLLAGPVDMAAATAAPGPWEIYDRVKGIPQARYVSRGYAATANLAVPMTVFRALGGFDANRLSGGDAEFCRRAGRAGHPLRYVEDARVVHPARSSWDEIATKARRVKGGQILSGPLSRRLLWLARTLLPPVRGAWLFLNARQHPLRHRFVAIAVLFRIWITEIAETMRLLAGGAPERR